jgi:hypothetical protein
MSLQYNRPFIAKVALLRGQAVILDTSVRGQVDLPGGANAAVIGFAVNDAAIGQEVAIALVGTCKAIAGDTSISIGDYVTGEGTDGKVKKLIDDNVLFNACGIALEDGDAEDQLIDILIVHGKSFTALS